MTDDGILQGLLTGSPRVGPCVMKESFRAISMLRRKRDWTSGGKRTRHSTRTPPRKDLQPGSENKGCGALGSSTIYGLSVDQDLPTIAVDSSPVLSIEHCSALCYIITTHIHSRIGSPVIGSLFTSPTTFVLFSCCSLLA